MLKDKKQLMQEKAEVTLAQQMNKIGTNLENANFKEL